MFDITFAEIRILIQPKNFSAVSIFHAHPISRIQTLVKVGQRVFNTDIETENSSTINGYETQPDTQNQVYLWSGSTGLIGVHRLTHPSI